MLQNTAPGNKIILGRSALLKFLNIPFDLKHQEIKYSVLEGLKVYIAAIHDAPFDGPKKVFNVFIRLHFIASKYASTAPFFCSIACHLQHLRTGLGKETGV